MEPMKISVLCVIFIEINCQLLDLTRCSLKSVTPEQQRDMLQCFTECCYNPCCKAVNIRTCEQSYIDTEEMDYVKQVREFYKQKLRPRVSSSFNAVTLVIIFSFYITDTFDCFLSPQHKPDALSMDCSCSVQTGPGWNGCQFTLDNDGSNIRRFSVFFKDGKLIQKG